MSQLADVNTYPSVGMFNFCYDHRRRHWLSWGWSMLLTCRSPIYRNQFQRLSVYMVYKLNISYLYITMVCTGHGFKCTPISRDGNGSVGYGLNGSPFLDWLRGSWVTASDPWWWNNCAVAAIFLFLVDIKKLLTHQVSPIIIAGGLILTYDFLLSRLRGLSSTTRLRPS